MDKIHLLYKIYYIKYKKYDTTIKNNSDLEKNLTKKIRQSGNLKNYFTYKYNKTIIFRLCQNSILKDKIIP